MDKDDLDKLNPNAVFTPVPQPPLSDKLLTFAIEYLDRCEKLNTDERKLFMQMFSGIMRPLYLVRMGKEKE